MFYDIFKEFCLQQRESPTGVAQKLGIGKSTVARWKKEGSVPRPDALNRIANYFGVPVDRLLGNEQKDNTPAASSDRDVDRFMELFAKLTPEQQERELAYLQQLVDAQDK